MKFKVGKETKDLKKKNVFSISKAISRFISNSQKVVQKVKPDAKIIISKKKTVQRKLKNKKQSNASDKSSKAIQPIPRIITVPDFKGKL